MPDDNREGSRWDVLVRTGAETPMGQLLRRYWWPIAGESELTDAKRTRAVRLMGEELVLYRDLSGNYGLIDRRCRHRRADMLHGFVEDCGLRCSYHGWLYDHTGACTEQPYEDIANAQARLKEQIKIKAYPVATRGGLVWAYLGPQPAPLLPDWEFFSWENGFRQIVVSEIPCNWFQCQENSIDPVHFEWQHGNWTIRARGKTGPYQPTHIKVDFTEFEYGFQYKRIRTDTDENDRLWQIGRVCLWPNALFTGNHIEFRVPMDDENTLSVTWHFSRVPKEREPYVQPEREIPTWHAPVKDEAGEWITSHVMNQDFLAWVGQGTIADRGREYLASSDRGIVLMRNQFLRDIDAVGKGKDPKATIRDPKINKRVMLPVAERKPLLEGLSIADLLRDPDLRSRLGDYIFQAGQPKEVRHAFLAAMGVNESEIAPLAGPVDILAPPEKRSRQAR